ncbi:BMP family ABC transporter substrate-binding protein [Borrelia coriaceae]|uniref:Nucleoside-binding protein n=1 Tax=Borrelia coriaceae ATCC 43381 TaxID=1408429 RepID=W5SUZ3_9SPIR|nr:BMP family ABC transporter substrate-binding protein [Borrelia coriaceae]AHH10488.1 Nucleoside-binding protein [Borrelia coriaceae ATCC 43381]UPA16190.1 BMP family ABC transporter substrate-binding protein [Borrelia coriaceae]
MSRDLFLRIFCIFISLVCLFLFVYITFFKVREYKSSYSKKIALFIPGIISGSPSYKAMYDFLIEFRKNRIDIEVKLFEAGFNRHEWIELLEKLLNSKNYDFLITTNNVMQGIIDKISPNYPYTKFLLFDSLVKNTNPQVYSLSYNVAEEAYILGYYVGLFLKSSDFSNKNVALIAGQEYPVMNNYIFPYFKSGISEVIDSEVFFRTLGNWHDSNRGKVLSDSLILDSGVSVILPIVGIAIEGVLSSVREHGVFAVLFDGEDYLDNKENIIGSGITNQRFYLEKVLDKALKGEIKYGTYKILGFRDGGVSFNLLNKFYVEKTDLNLKKRLEEKIREINNTEIKINLE